MVKAVSAVRLGLKVPSAIILLIRSAAAFSSADATGFASIEAIQVWYQVKSASLNKTDRRVPFSS